MPGGLNSITNLDGQRCESVSTPNTHDDLHTWHCISLVGARCVATCGDGVSTSAAVSPIVAL